MERIICCLNSRFPKARDRLEQCFDKLDEEMIDDESTLADCSDELLASFGFPRGCIVYMRKLLNGEEGSPKTTPSTATTSISTIADLSATVEMSGNPRMCTLVLGPASFDHDKDEIPSLHRLVHDISISYSFTRVNKDIQLRIMETLIKICRGIVARPDDMRRRKISLCNSVMVQSLGLINCPTIDRFLSVLGFIPHDGCIVNCNPNVPTLEAAIRALNLMSDGESTNISHYVFNPYQSKTTSAVQTPAEDDQALLAWNIKMEATKQRLEYLTQLFDTGGTYEELPPRPRIYKPSVYPKPEGFDADEDELLSLEEVSSLKAAMMQKPKFTSRSVQILAQLDKRQIHTESTIRVILPSGHTAEFTAHPASNAKHLHLTVVGLLDKELDINDFELFHTPPKKVLQLQSPDSLTKLGLVPSVTLRLAMTKDVTPLWSFAGADEAMEEEELAKAAKKNRSKGKEHQGKKEGKKEPVQEET